MLDKLSHARTLQQSGSISVGGGGPPHVNLTYCVHVLLQGTIENNPSVLAKAWSLCLSPGMPTHEAMDIGCVCAAVEW